jgi:hypothetical protein
MKWYAGLVLTLALSVLLTSFAAPGSSVAAQGKLSAEDMAKANNPLADMKMFNLQNYYIPKLYGVDNEVANTFWIRAAAPLGRWLTRASLPLSTVPTGQTDPQSGLGDFNIFSAYMVVQKPEKSIGIGPLLVAPTASDDALGSGKWQAGAAAVAFAVPSPVIQLGGLVTWQASFAGDDDRADTSSLVAQPFGFWQLGGGTYLRTAPIWFFNLKNGDYNVPFGLGIGKVLKTERVVYNIFIEPQFTVLHSGVGQPAFQIFTGLNMQFLSK